MLVKNNEDNDYDMNISIDVLELDNSIISKI